MSSQFVASSIEGIIFAMAEGLADAQDRLNLLDPFDVYGRPRPQYHVPYLDFDLKVYMQTTQETISSNGRVLSESSVGARTVGNAFTQQPFTAQKTNVALIMAPSQSTSNSSSVSQITSTISGRFVSVPPNDGMPQVKLGVQLREGITPSSYVIKVTAEQANGSVIEGARIEFNINESETLQENNLSQISFTATEFFATGEALTTQFGSVEVTANFDNVPVDIGFVHIDVQLGVVTTSLLLAR